MDKKELIAREIEQVPEPLLDEVLEFVRSLKVKVKPGDEGLEVSLLSESALQQDWLRPEEDAAWQDL